MSDPLLATAEVVDLLKWAVGGIAAGLVGASKLLHGRLRTMDQKIGTAIEIATHARNAKTAIALEAERRALDAERRYATKEDVARLERTLVDGVNRLADKLDALRGGHD